MSRVRIPNDKVFRGIFPGEFFGNIWMAKNIDLERIPGAILPSETLASVFDSTDDADLTLPIAFVRTAADGTDRWWAMGGKLFKTTNTNPEAGWAQDAIASSPTAPVDDMIEFADALLVSTDTNIDRLSTTWDDNWWSGTLTGTAVMTSSPHRYGIFAGAVLITDGRFINTYDGTIARDPALTLPADFESQWVRATADYAYIGCDGIGDREEGEVFFWDRAASTFNARYEAGDRRVLAGFTVYGIPYIITGKGAIKRFTGQGFRTVQQFPTLELNKEISTLHPNGVTVLDNGTVLINVNFGVLADMRVLSGVWLYNANNNNLYHHLSGDNNASNDYGQLEVSDVGAIVTTRPTQGRYLIGQTTYEVYTGTTESIIHTSDEDSTSGQRALIITPKIESRDVNGFFRQIFPIFRRFRNSGDRLRFAYRVRESNTLPAYETITWVTSTTFTGANDNVIVGDFVLVLAGPNAGALAKITAITDAAPNTFTIDLTLNSSTSDARAMYLPFVDLSTISSQAIQHTVMRIAQRSSWVQFLIEARGDETSPEFMGLIHEFDNIPF